MSTTTSATATVPYTVLPIDQGRETENVRLLNEESTLLHQASWVCAAGLFSVSTIVLLYKGLPVVALASLVAGIGSFVIINKQIDLRNEFSRKLTDYIGNAFKIQAERDDLVGQVQETQCQLSEVTGQLEEHENQNSVLARTAGKAGTYKARAKAWHDKYLDLGRKLKAADTYADQLEDFLRTNGIAESEWPTKPPVRTPGNGDSNEGEAPVREGSVVTFANPVFGPAGDLQLTDEQQVALAQGVVGVLRNTGVLSPGRDVARAVRAADEVIVESDRVETAGGPSGTTPKKQKAEAKEEEAPAE